MFKITYLLYFSLALATLHAGHEVNKPYVIGSLNGQLGNQYFEIATACALAWDHDAEPFFPDLVNRRDLGIPMNYQHSFFRCNTSPPKRPYKFIWKEKAFTWNPIQFHDDMVLIGYFQCEKYFKHHRDRLLELFAPAPADLDYIYKKYGFLLKHPMTVGIQIRDYSPDDRNEDFYVQCKREYFSKAMSLFPDEVLFIVSSNNLDFARKNIDTSFKNIVYLNNESYCMELFILSLCKHNIISNSTFGWWAAWLNQNPEKVVVAPDRWFEKRVRFLPDEDILPEEWIKVSLN